MNDQGTILALERLSRILSVIGDVGQETLAFPNLERFTGSELATLKELASVSSDLFMKVDQAKRLLLDTEQISIELHQQLVLRKEQLAGILSQESKNSRVSSQSVLTKSLKDECKLMAFRTNLCLCELRAIQANQ